MVDDVDGIGIEFGGARWHLLGGRGAWREADGSLVVADLHLGKARSFRAGGVPVPAGTTAETIARLERMLSVTKPARLIIVGDLLHDAAGLEAPVIEALAALRGRWRHVSMVLVQGNHDRRAGRLPEALDITVTDAPMEDGGVLFCHDPAEAIGARRPGIPVVAGHVHPVVRLVDDLGDHLRAPCFHLVARFMLRLPALGAFTGGAVVRPRRGDRVFVVRDHEDDPAAITGLPGPRPGPGIVEITVGRRGRSIC